MEATTAVGVFVRDATSDAVPRAATVPPTPSNDETKGATKMKTGAAMSEVSKIAKPGRVSPRAKTIIPITRAMNRIGPAMSQEPKPKNGTTEMRHTSPIKTQLVMIKLRFCLSGW